MKKIFLVLAVLIVAAGCSDWLDVNTDPNVPTSTSADLTLPAGQASLAVRLGGTLFNMGGFFAQYWSQAPEANQYNTLERYDLNTDFLDNDYIELFAGGLNDLEMVRTITTEEEDWGNYLAATVTRAMAYQVWVDMVDQIPFDEALQGVEFVNPTWEDGEVVYGKLIDEIDAALDNIESDSRVTTADLVYGGDINQWIGLANAVKLKLYMRQRFVNDVSTEVNALITNNVFMTSDAAFSGFSKEENKRNPWFETTQQLNTDANHIATMNMVSFLSANGDPRIDVFYNVAETPGAHVGIYPAEKQIAIGQLTSDFSRPKIEATAPVVLYSMAELYLFIAEAELIFNSDADAAKVAYDNAILANFVTHGIDETGNPRSLYQGTTSSYYFDVTDSDDALFEQIMMQKWVCLCEVNNFEAWCELRRTDIPKYWGDYDNYLDGDPYTPGQFVDPAKNDLPDGYHVPNRLPYPDVAVTRNTKTPSLTGTQAFTEKVWWDAN